MELTISLKTKNVLHFLGYPQGRQPRPGVLHLIDECVLQARGLISARGAWRRLPVEEAETLGLEPQPARSLVIGLVTIGEALETVVSETLKKGEPTRALILDACADAAVEEAADRLGAGLAGADDEETDEAPSLSCRISPGYGRWPLTAQKGLFARLPHRELGVGLRQPSCLMVPRKSISFAMWLGADARPLAGLSGCQSCQLERCRYRRSGC